MLKCLQMCKYCVRVWFVRTCIVFHIDCAMGGFPCALYSVNGSFGVAVLVCFHSVAQTLEYRNFTLTATPRVIILIVYSLFSEHLRNSMDQMVTLPHEIA